MNEKILVTYATLANSTAEVAQAIGQRLRATGADVDVYPAGMVADMRPYSAAVVGSGVRWGKPYEEALTFLKEQQQALRTIPTAYFIVCGTMREDTEENRRRASSYMDVLRASAPRVHPFAMELFGGRVENENASLLLRFTLKLKKKRLGDYRNWAAIRAWAEHLGNRLPNVVIDRDAIQPLVGDRVGTSSRETTRRYVPVLL